MSPITPRRMRGSQGSRRDVAKANPAESKMASNLKKKVEARRKQKEEYDDTKFWKKQNDIDKFVTETRTRKVIA